MSFSKQKHITKNTKNNMCLCACVFPKPKKTVRNNKKKCVFVSHNFPTVAKVYAFSVDALIIIAPETRQEQTGEALGSLHDSEATRWRWFLKGFLVFSRDFPGFVKFFQGFLFLCFLGFGYLFGDGKAIVF